MYDDLKTAYPGTTSRAFPAAIIEAAVNAQVEVGSPEFFGVELALRACLHAEERPADELLVEALLDSFVSEKCDNCDEGVLKKEVVGKNSFRWDCTNPNCVTNA